MPDSRDAVSFRARLRAEGRYWDAVVIEADHESLAVLSQSDVARGYGDPGFIRNPVPTAVGVGDFIRIWGKLSEMTLGVTLLCQPPLDKMVAFYNAHGALPPADEGEHLWLREP